MNRIVGARTDLEHKCPAEFPVLLQSRMRVCKGEPAYYR
jgi:hypothetical protein